MHVCTLQGRPLPVNPVNGVSPESDVFCRCPAIYSIRSMRARGERGYKRAMMPRPAPLSDGERTDPSGKPVRNKILLSLPDKEYRKLRPHLEYVELPHRASLQEPLARATHA